jgi:hypothetical protein
MLEEKMVRRTFCLFAAPGVLLAAILLIVPYDALSQESAEDLHQAGVELFNDMQYAQAAEAFTRAYKLKPVWKLLFNIGQCEAANKRYGVALDAFEEYIVKGGDEVPEDRRDYVSNEVRRIQPMVGILEVEASDGVSIYVDDMQRGTTPLNGPVRVASGSHKISLRQGPEILLARTIKVAGGVTTKVAPPKPEAEEPATEPVAKEPAEPLTASETDTERGGLWTGGWVVFGVGAAVGIAGCVTGGMALSKGGDLDSDYPDGVPSAKSGEVDSMDNLAVTTNVLLGVGGAMVFAGAIMLIVDSVGKDDDSDVALVPSFGPHFTGLGLEGRF